MTVDEINAKLAESMGWNIEHKEGCALFEQTHEACCDCEFSPATDANDLLRVLHHHQMIGYRLDRMRWCVGRMPPLAHRFEHPDRSLLEQKWKVVEPHDGTPESITLAAATALVRALEER